jgi:delta 1-pyrroline-5-carboxylate dehydrogenase
MAPKCTICHHKQRESIDVDITSGVSNRTIATQYGVSISAVQRHRSHIPKALAEAKRAEDLARSDDLLEQLERALKIAWTVVNSCLEAGDNRTVLQGVKEIRESIKFLCEIATEIAKRKNPEQTADAETITSEYDFSLLTDDELLTMTQMYDKCRRA